MATRTTESTLTICVVAASLLTVRAFLIEHLKGLAKLGNVRVLTDFRGAVNDVAWPASIAREQVYIPRAISPILDLYSILRLWRLFSRYRPTLVFSVTAKAGFITMLSAYIARVPVRIHCFTGQAWVEKNGLSKRILKCADCITARLSTHLLADSPSQRSYLEKEGVAPRGRIHVPAYGSISGVDVQRFKPDPNSRIAMRSEFGLKEDDLLVLFLARIKRSKGILELVEAFKSLSVNYPHLHLAIIGPDEEGLDPLLASLTSNVASRVHRVSSFVAAHECYLVAADIFCLPSHYEGFGSVVIEAAACGLPAIAARIYGLTDAIEDGKTGLLHAVGNVNDLRQKLEQLVDNHVLRNQFGIRARERAMEKFDKDTVVEGYLGYISGVLEENTRVP